HVCLRRAAAHTCCLVLLVLGHRARRRRHSFPTRRSSDLSGNPIAGATVTITDTRTGATRTITTGANGTFAATGLVTGGPYTVTRSEEHTSELQSRENLVCRLLLEKKKYVLSSRRQRATGP